MNKDIDIPRTIFTGTLRQITPASLNAHGEAILRACAPRFLPLSQDEREKLFDSRKHELIDPNVQQFYVPARPFRRYSGDYFSDFFDEHRLDVGCYYSVCIDQEGRDEGTLIGELNAYRSTEVGFYVIFFDCFNEKVAGKFGLEPSSNIGVYVPNPAGLLTRLPSDAPQTLREELIHAAQEGRSYGMVLGCVITQARIDEVVDLRQPETQECFFRRYVPSGPFPTPASSFTGILPELLQPHLGGSTGSNMRLQVIGADLRASGVKALIYPSARNDLEVRYQNGRPTYWRGWNMVRYPSGAPRKVTHYDAGGWETEFWNGLVCEHTHNVSDNTSGWRIRGLEVVNMLRYDHVMLPRLRSTQDEPSTGGALGRLWRRVFGHNR